MRKTVFISYHYKQDAVVARNLAPLLTRSGGRYAYDPLYVDSREHREDELYNEIKSEMSKCDGVIFVVGDDTHNRPWVNDEAELAKSKDRVIVAVQRPGTTGGIPNKLKENNIKPVDWDRDQLCDELDRKFAEREKSR